MSVKSYYSLKTTDKPLAKDFHQCLDEANEVRAPSHRRICPVASATAAYIEADSATGRSLSNFATDLHCFPAFLA
jgi:hypothetical protein